MGVALLAAAAPGTAGVATLKESAALTVRVSGFESDSGQLMLALHNTSETFLTRRAPFRAAKLEITGDQVEFVFRDLPPGMYSVAAFHDKNRNEDLDGVLAIPRERYGFSRNPPGRFGPPRYDETSFSLKGDTAIAIALRGVMGN